MPFNVIPLVNTCHALGFSACLMLDALISFRCHLRATKMRLSARVLNLKGLECITPVLTQIGVVLGLGFIVKQRFGYGFDYMLLAIMRGYDLRTLVSPMLSS